MAKANANKLISLFLICLMSTSLLLTGCSAGYGNGGGIISSIFSEGIYEDCSRGGSLSAEGKVTEIDGIELKLPVDWNYAHSQQSSFDGTNWEGDDSYRGIGMFNCNEEGDNSDKFKNSYSINMRWEDTAYGSVDGTYSAHAGYKATAVSDESMVVGGSSASCVSGGSIINQKSVGVSGYRNALAKAKIMVVNPKNGKACVCGPGFVPSEISTDLNWGGAPLGLLGGISEAVSEAITDSGSYEEIQPHTGDDNVALELYFVDVNTPYGPCEYDGANIKSKSKKGCSTSNVDNSDAANLAVTVSYDNDNPNYADHVMVQKPTGSNGSATLLPTTNKAIEIRKLAANGNDDTADCGFFVASVVILTLDKNYPPNGTSIQEEYIKNTPDKWEKVDEGRYTDLFNAGNVQPGDVLLTENHTVMWVGYDAIKEQYDYVNDTNYCIVGASQDTHGPYIQKHSIDTSKSYRAYRHKGEPDPLLPEAEELDSVL